MKELKVIQTERGGVVVDQNAEPDYKLGYQGWWYSLDWKEAIDGRVISGKFDGFKIAHTIYPLTLEGIPMIGEPKPAQISEEDLRKAMLHASYETFNNKGIISHRNIDEYIQSINPLPTSAIFTDDGEFVNFKY